ncbi:hypothetical protein AOLI_G00250750 [Acnodon oligacanthus]
MWKKLKPFLLKAAATLSSVAFCLDTGPREPDKVIRYGTLVGDHYKGILNETVGDLETRLHDKAAGDCKGYQADQPEATGQLENQLAELERQCLRPSVWCDYDSVPSGMEISCLSSAMVIELGISVDAIRLKGWP